MNIKTEIYQQDMDIIS